MQSFQRPRTSWPWIIFWVALAGLVASVVWAFFSYGGLQDRLAALHRADVPGSVVIDVSAPQTLTVFYEDPSADAMFVVQSSDANTLPSVPVDLVVTGPSGDLIETARYERDLRFDYDGRLLTAMATFEAADAGTYTVEASGDVSAAVGVSVGEIVEYRLIAGVVGVVGLFIASLVGMTLALILIAVRRGRPPTSQPERPLVGSGAR